MTLACFLRDESTPLRQGLLQQIVLQGATVPSIWHLEVASAVQATAKSHRIKASDMDRLLADIALLPIVTDASTAHNAWTRTWRLSLQHKLTVYDAAYLELAIRHDLPLATLDAALARAATTENVIVLQ
jgi:predicted nucleic acid-binding protein